MRCAREPYAEAVVSEVITRIDWCSSPCTGLCVCLSGVSSAGTSLSGRGSSGRDRLQYSINNGNLKIMGIIEVLGGERLLVHFSEPLTSKRAVNTFGASDELILTWQF